MGKLFSYSIVSGLIMLGMYLIYKLFIARDNQHCFNRVMLLLIYLVSFTAYPIYCFIDYHYNKSSETLLTVNIHEVENILVESMSQSVWSTILIWIFFTGGIIVTIKTLITWIRIVKVIYSGDKVKTEHHTIVVIDNDKIAPFSWIKYIVVNRSDLDSSIIIDHELQHIQSFHWIDLLIAQLVCIINWFNPASWLMRDELMLVHEYQADLSVINKGHNPYEYQILLLKKAVGSRFPSLANSINHSKLKKRITMMYKSKSRASSKLKALALVPMVALVLGVVSVPSVKAAVSAISDSKLSLDKGSENSAVTGKFRIASLNNSGIETTVVVEGQDLGNNLSVSSGTFTNNGQNYSAKSLNTTMTNGAATITAVFPVSESYENASIVFNINGQDIKLNLDEFRRNSQTSSISISPSNGIVISNGNATLSTVGEMEIYLDGKKISEDEMKALNPETIGSMSIDKQNHTIIITSK